MSKRWHSDIRVVNPVMEMNGYCVKRKNGSHYIYENEKGDVISLPKSLNRMLWLGECKRHSLKGDRDVLSKISSRR